MKVPDMRGFSFYFSFGANAGLIFEWTKNVKRIVLWRICFCWMPRDLDIFHAFLLDYLLASETEKTLQKLKVPTSESAL